MLQRPTLLYAVLVGASLQAAVPMTSCRPAGGAQPPAATLPPGIQLIDTAVIVAARLSESSGVTASRRRPGTFWTHNDSGDGPVLYATDSTGADLGYVRVVGARNVDWEDIASGPCFRTRATCLYVADTGDNTARRRHVVVYRLVEPDPPASAGDTTRNVTILDSLVLRYPDLPHDAEGLAVTSDGWLLLTSKDRDRPAHLFRARIPTREATLTLEDAGELPVSFSIRRGRLVTGADASSDGRYFIARTYVSLHLFRLERGGRVTPLMPPDGALIPVVEDQGEGVAFWAPDRLVLTSERSLRDHAILMRLRLTGLEP